MLPGFRVRHPVTGEILVDGTRRLLILGGTQIVAAGASGTIVSDVFLGGEPLCFCSGMRGDSESSFPIANFIPPIISISGNVLTYNNIGASHRLMFGAF